MRSSPMDTIRAMFGDSEFLFWKFVVLLAGSVIYNFWKGFTGR